MYVVKGDPHIYTYCSFKIYHRRAPSNPFLDVILKEVHNFMFKIDTILNFVWKNLLYFLLLNVSYTLMTQSYWHQMPPDWVLQWGGVLSNCQKRQHARTGGLPLQATSSWLHAPVISGCLLAQVPVHQEWVEGNLVESWYGNGKEIGSGPESGYTGSSACQILTSFPTTELENQSRPQIPACAYPRPNVFLPQRCLWRLNFSHGVQQASLHHHAGN